MIWKSDGNVYLTLTSSCGEYSKEIILDGTEEEHFETLEEFKNWHIEHCKELYSFGFFKDSFKDYNEEKFGIPNIEVNINYLDFWKEEE